MADWHMGFPMHPIFVRIDENRHGNEDPWGIPVQNPYHYQDKQQIYVCLAWESRFPGVDLDRACQQVTVAVVAFVVLVVDRRIVVD